VSCKLTSLPVFREFAEREQQRITQETRRAIAQSQSLREVDNIYTHEVVPPGDFKLVRMSRDFRQETFLVYGYQSTQGWKDVKNYYRNHLTKAGWQLNAERDVSWGDDFMRFQKQSYQVTLYKTSVGSSENYTLVCKRI
jgi:hypothetical protein